MGIRSRFGREGQCYRYRNVYAQRISALYWLMIIAYGIGAVVAHDVVAGLMGTSLGAVLLLRSFRMQEVDVCPCGIVTSTLYRRRYYAFDDLARVDVAIGQTAYLPYRREFLQLVMRDGSIVEHRDMSSRPSTTKVTLVQAAAAHINYCINQQEIEHGG